MKREEIMETIHNLAKSQGYYGRLLEQIKDLDSEDYEIIMHTLESQNFKEPLDLVLYLET